MTQHEYSILKVSKYGDKVTLNDNSKWSISPGDSTKCACWYPTQRIIIKETTDHVYEYQLVNLDTSNPDVAECHKI
ncbi:MAG: hypothetical protein ABIJ24_01140 [Nitrospinota bacterium]